MVRRRSGVTEAAHTDSRRGQPGGGEHANNTVFINEPRFPSRRTYNQDVIDLPSNQSSRERMMAGFVYLIILMARGRSDGYWRLPAGGRAAKDGRGGGEWVGGRARGAGRVCCSLAGWAAQRGSRAVYAIHQALSKY